MASESWVDDRQWAGRSRHLGGTAHYPGRPGPKSYRGPGAGNLQPMANSGGDVRGERPETKRDREPDQRDDGSRPSPSRTGSVARHRAKGWTAWLSWFRKLHREQAQARRESVAAQRVAEQARLQVEYQGRQSADFMDKMSRFLERHG
jgi:hypothetical protein